MGSKAEAQQQIRKVAGNYVKEKGGSSGDASKLQTAMQRLDLGTSTAPAASSAAPAQTETLMPSAPVKKKPKTLIG